MKTLLLSTAALVLLGGCQYLPAATQKAEMENPYTALLLHPDRPVADAEDDAARKPAAVLGFLGVKQGMSVYELEAGGGYYTELLSRVVGSGGSVVMQNPAHFDTFLGDSVEQRLADDRLANVTLRKSSFDDLAAVAGSMDMVTWFLGPHELWYTPDGAEPGVFGDPASAFAGIAQALKPGGQFIVLDHSAPDGAPESTGGTTHRIDKAIIIAQAEAAGLTLIEESDLLANPEDDRTVMVFDPAVRRKTDRFLLKFQK